MLVMLLVAVVYGIDRIISVKLQQDLDRQAVGREVNQQHPQAPALDLTGFNPGNLISDEEFYNPAAMSESQVRAFIQKWNTGCESTNDVPCLAEYVQQVEYREPNRFCVNELPGGKLDAASIIYQVAQACEINPAVLLTTLQKEQGLITASGGQLKPERYQIAMGYACPDHSSCDPQFFGFLNQVYGAAQQFQRYRLQPEKYAVKAWENNEIRFHPNAECQARTVYVENQATASLYNYTPYQPNDATLSGYSDACSTWGNLNFYGLYRAWFK